MTADFVETLADARRNGAAAAAALWLRTVRDVFALGARLQLDAAAPGCPVCRALAASGRRPSR